MRAGRPPRGVRPPRRLMTPVRRRPSDSGYWKVSWNVQVLCVVTVSPGTFWIVAVTV
jgi:hypothetical protein